MHGEHGFQPQDAETEALIAAELNKWLEQGAASEYQEYLTQCPPGEKKFFPTIVRREDAEGGPLTNVVLTLVDPLRPHRTSMMALVAKKDGSKRVVNWVQDLNTHMVTKVFAHERLEDITARLVPGAMMIVLDIKSAFNHLVLQHASRQHAGFFFRGKWYVQNVMFFGMHPAPYYWTKLLRASAVKRAREHGLVFNVFVDDMLIVIEPSYGQVKTSGTANDIDQMPIANMYKRESANNAPSPASMEECLRQKSVMEEALTHFGFVINKEKGSGPAHEAQYLGYVIKTHPQLKEALFVIPSKKRRSAMGRLRGLIEAGIKLKEVPVRRVASVVGVLQFLCRAVRLGPLRLRAAHRLISSVLMQGGEMHVGNWSKNVVLDMATVADLEWWLGMVKENGGKPTHQAPAEFTITTDASKAGWGGTLHQGAALDAATTAQSTPMLQACSKITKKD